MFPLSSFKLTGLRDGVAKKVAEVSFIYSCLCFLSRICPSKKQIYQSHLHFVENLAVKVVAQVIAQKHWETCPTWGVTKTKTYEN